jgi:sulfur-carrier protein
LQEKRNLSDNGRVKTPENSLKMKAITVNVKLFGTLRKSLPDYDPEKGIDVDLEEGKTIGDLLDMLHLSDGETKLLLVKGLARRLEYQLEDCDELGVFLPVGGG